MDQAITAQGRMVYGLGDRRLATIIGYACLYDQITSHSGSFFGRYMSGDSSFHPILRERIKTNINVTSLFRTNNFGEWFACSQTFVGTRTTQQLAFFSNSLFHTPCSATVTLRFPYSMSSRSCGEIDDSIELCFLTCGCEGTIRVYGDCVLFDMHSALA